jgi:hypothetical protein
MMLSQRPSFFYLYTYWDKHLLSQHLPCTFPSGPKFSLQMLFQRQPSGDANNTTRSPDKASLTYFRVTPPWQIAQSLVYARRHH